jgi:hypothetical protein
MHCAFLHPANASWVKLVSICSCFFVFPPPRLLARSLHQQGFPIYCSTRTNGQRTHCYWHIGPVDGDACSLDAEEEEAAADASTRHHTLCAARTLLGRAQTPTLAAQLSFPLRMKNLASQSPHLSFKCGRTTNVHR